MREIKVFLGKRSYKIIIGYEILKHLPSFIKKLKLGNDALIITSPNIKKIVGPKLIKALKKARITLRFETVPDSEKSKSQNTAFKLISKISGYAKKKRISIIALGGGVIGDLAGFVASVYKRGVPYIQIPTTLLAQVDSAIGGKVAIDLPYGKNLVGAFYQPRMVFCDTSLLNTLPKKQIRSGLAEIVKCGVIKDEGLFSYIEKHYSNILKLKKQPLEYIIARCAAIKAKVVSSDEKETKGIRTILNFGHTIGHAIEAAGGFRKYNHGEAIGLGMIVASRIAYDLKVLRQTRAIDRIEKLIRRIGLSVKISGLSINRIINAQSFDKKFIHGKNRFVLPKKIGQVAIVEGIPIGIIRRAIKETM